MHDLLPEGEELRRAVKWVSAHLQENPIFQHTSSSRRLFSSLIYHQRMPNS